MAPPALTATEIGLGTPLRPGMAGRSTGSARRMRSGVLDVGSNSAHLKIVDLRPGEPPRPVRDVKHRTRPAESINSARQIEEVAIERLVPAVGKAARAAEAEQVDELIAFATSAVRDAANREAIVTRVAMETGIRLGFLEGRDEARLTFLAAREWYGWSAGPILLVDLGGGSLEIAYGDGREPELAVSLPLGAGRLTREYLPGDPPRRKDVRRLTREVCGRLETGTRELREAADPLDICPWALREGISVRRMQTLPGTALTDDLMPLVQTSAPSPPMQVAAVPDRD